MNVQTLWMYNMNQRELHVSTFLGVWSSIEEVNLWLFFIVFIHFLYVII